MKKNKEQYNILFPDAESKAKAFDKLAEEFYDANFGSMAKSDIELLMFSIYIERILDRSENDMSSYDDYTLSKQLGITQSRVSTLKQKKQLVYPYKFDWKKSFLRVCDSARYIDGRIRITIMDKNLYNEVKYAIERDGGIVDGSLNPHQLIVTPAGFIQLLTILTDSKEEHDKVIEEIYAHIKSDNALESDMQNNDMSWKDIACDLGTDTICEILSSCIPLVGKSIGNAVNSIISKIKRR